MKKQYFVFLILLSALIASCGDDAEGRITLNDKAPSQVSNVTTAAGPGEVYISWNVPSDDSFMYTKIEYTNAKGESEYQIIGKDRENDNGTYTATVSGFAKADPITFSLFACSVRGNNKGALEINASPGNPAFIMVGETVDVEPYYGGVNVSWENETVASVNIVLKYSSKTDGSKAGSESFKVAGNTKGTKFIPLSVGLGEFLSDELCTISVTAEDEAGNASDVFPFETTLLKITRLSRTKWTFPGFVDTNDAAIGYSSQEAGGEGASPNGRVIALIDDDAGSFWHTAWKTSSAYPHFFIIDMNEEVNVGNIALRRRTGNSGTNKGQSFYTCTDDGAVDKTNPDSWQWQEKGWFEFDPSTDATQLFKLSSSSVARYIKVSFAESDKGSSEFVMISEINAYDSND